MAIDVYSKNILINSGIHWYSNGFNGGFDSLIFTEMKVRRKPYLSWKINERISYHKMSCG